MKNLLNLEVLHRQLRLLALVMYSYGKIPTTAPKFKHIENFLYQLSTRSLLSFQYALSHHLGLFIHLYKASESAVGRDFLIMKGPFEYFSNFRTPSFRKQLQETSILT